MPPLLRRRPPVSLDPLLLSMRSSCLSSKALLRQPGGFEGFGALPIEAERYQSAVLEPEEPSNAPVDFRTPVARFTGAMEHRDDGFVISARPLNFPVERLPGI